MATLFVSEYQNVAAVGHTSGPASVSGQAPLEPALAEYTVTSWPATSQAFNAKTTFVRIHTDAICSIVFNTDGTAATTSNKRLAANQTEYFGVPPGYSYKVSVVSNT